jgi:hypothetical protein
MPVVCWNSGALLILPQRFGQGIATFAQRIGMKMRADRRFLTYVSQQLLAFPASCVGCGI